MHVSVESVGVLAPGLQGWEAASAVMATPRNFRAAALDPPLPACLAPAERRRSCPTVRLAIAVAEEALLRSSLVPQDMAMVFASYEAAGTITHQLCEVLAGTREVSPTQFHNSVHNAPSGYYSIAMNARCAATSICRGEWSFAAGLLSAAAQVVADKVPVLYVCYDCPLPPPICEVMPVIESTAIALVLTPEASSAALATWKVCIVPQGGVTAWEEWIPRSWHANASARGFAALDSLASPSRLTATMPLSPELCLEVTRC